MTTNVKPTPAFTVSDLRITRTSDGRSYTVASAPRKFLIEYCQWNDPNGAYTDEKSLIELDRVSPLAELRAIVLDWIADDLSDNVKNKLRAYAKAGLPSDTNVWGTTRQIDAENRFYRYARRFMTPERLDELDSYTLKATTEEGIEFALKLLGVKLCTCGAPIGLQPCFAHAVKP